MKTFILIACFYVHLSSFAQFAPKEDYIECSKVSCYSPGSLANIIVKGGAFLYYNDSCLLIHLDGFGNKTLFFKIDSKKWNDGMLLIRCFDSSKSARPMNRTDSTPDLVIQIGYSGTETEYNTYSSKSTPLYLTVTCFFYTKNFVINFSYPIYYRPQKIPAIKKKYPIVNYLLPPGSH